MFTAMCTHDHVPDGPCEIQPNSTPKLLIHPVGDSDPHRGEVEAFIHRIYAQRYGADVRQFAPILVSLRDATGIVAAAGYRSAGDGPLFLERYFGAPIESVLSSGSAVPPERNRIVEIGHLSAARAGEGRRLIRLMALHLQSLPFEWVVSTMTTGLRHMFLRLGITPLALGRADPDSLGADAAQWGRYYEHHPVVLAGRLHQALGQLARRRVDAERP
jgi:hypothetical protein